MCDTEKKTCVEDAKACSCKPYNPYEDTVHLMLSDNYKDRFVAEYRQTKIRYEKLKVYNTRIEAAFRSCGKVKEPPHDCPFDMLKQQEKAMEEYLRILELRAIIEGIEL